ncbi:MAG TPA: PEP/pyruvate-binding domain-containing protein [Candidatus Krumholzibacteria bacterium]|nr:PEP/pyruvate-binding domain-containing protein [Candidatus Krumholzibacteria bacterium]HPD71816.1 PEP/pyruvate-binding domain-containing protein [Candidatus Krumholzibacteria bacterium]HRY41251.1 PEP/pyruvate-binding domain-containing protein [Candidatus Krumholzibacteria bacterium]
MVDDGDRFDPLIRGSVAGDARDAGRAAPPAVSPPAIEVLLRKVESQFTIVAGSAAKVADGSATLRERLNALGDPGLALACGRRLAALLRAHHGKRAHALFPFLCDQLFATADPIGLALDLLQARDLPLRRQAVDAVVGRWTAGDLAPDVALAEALAAALASLGEADGGSAAEASLLDRAAAFLGRLAAGDARVEPDPERSLEELLRPGVPEALRGLAARLLDRGGQPLPADRLERLVGVEAAAVLGGVCLYTRASHRDLVDLTPDGGVSPARVAQFAAAQATLGATALGAVIGALGWRAVSTGLWVERWIGWSVDGSYPLLVTPAEAEILEQSGEGRRVWDRFLVIAHGGTAETGVARDEETVAVRQFRRHNLVHAELLGEILEVAPVTPAKVARILAGLDEVVTLFAALFAGHTEDAARVAERYAALRAPIAAGIAGVPAGQALDAELTRLVQMFEDPRTLDEVRTLHGLKRYLHQQGLRLAFRRFRSSRTANRTVDLAVVAGERVVHTLRKIRYLDFEPLAHPGAIPFFPALVVEAFAHRLLEGRTDAPDVEILIYGNEVQTFVNFRNHPAFLRIDFSPPLRGGMVDLEYFGVSQYELEHHPDLSLPWIQRAFRRLDFDATADGQRLHIRYDKERAFDFADLVRGTRRLCSLLPHLMDLDWNLGGLRYPPPAKAAIADHWADWIARWGLLPVDDLLTSDRRAILREIRDGPAGPEQVAWDGWGEVVDRFFGARCDAVWLRVQAAREAGSLRAAGEPDAPLRFAAMLAEGSQALAGAARLAGVVAAVERHLRFTTVGSIQGHPVQQASLLLPGEVVEVSVLRDGNGIARLALARERPFRYTPGPPPRCDAEGGAGRAIDDRDLLCRLRRDNYLAASHDLPAEALRAEQEALVSLFAAADPLAVPAPAAGDRTVAGIVAAPGRAAGVAVFYRADLTPDDLDGCVLFAPALRPADTPLLRRVAAIVSTGGGVLSHAGLIALELGKPSLLVEGSWRLGEASRPELGCRTVDYREDQQSVGVFCVALRRDLREREEVLRAGDLVVVDAELGCLGVLGQDRDALALQGELSRLDTVTSELMHSPEGPRKLELRGRFLRTTHQLAKLLARLDQPALARHAARELLSSRRLDGDTDGADLEATGRSDLLRRLFANRRCGATAREAAIREAAELGRRLDALREDTQRALATAETVHEVLYLRLGVRRLQRMLAAASRSLAQAGAPVAGDPDSTGGRLDQRARERLETLRARIVADLARGAAAPEQWWRLRSLLSTAEALDQLLGPAPAADVQFASRRRAHAALVDGEQKARARLADRALVTSRDGGLELALAIGGKGAGLAEIERCLGATSVPPWFAVSDAAFRRSLGAGIGAAEPALGLVAGTPILIAIDRVLEHPDLEVRDQAAAIRELWRSLVLPVDLAQAIAGGYRSLGEASGSGTEPFVAVRSSTREEDSTQSSWAGQFDTFLYIRGEESVLEHLKLAWASLWSERALQHRQALRAAGVDLELEAYPGGGILIQRIVDSRVAGVLQTLAAASGQPREMVLNVGLGLGEGVVSGAVEVDQVVVSRTVPVDIDPLRFRYTVGDKRSRVVFDRRTGQGTRLEDTLYHQRLRPALEYPDLCAIVRAAARLEAAFGYPLDLEFAFEEDTLWILQARPIVAFQDALRETCAHSPWVRT